MKAIRVFFTDLGRDSGNWLPYLQGAQQWILDQFPDAIVERKRRLDALEVQVPDEKSDIIVERISCQFHCLVRT